MDDIDPLLVQAVQKQESNNDPDSVSKAGAIGLMQTMPDTLRDPGYGVKPAQDDSAEELQRVGKDYLTAMHTKYADPNIALMAYNWGPDHVNKWLDKGGDPEEVPAETRDYISKVNKHYQKLKSDASESAQTTTNTQPVSYSTVQPSEDPLVTRANETDNFFLSGHHDTTDKDDPLAARATENDDKSNEKSSKTMASVVSKDPFFQGEAAISGYGQGLRDVGGGIQSLLGGSTLGGILDTPQQRAAETLNYEKTFGNKAVTDAGVHGGPIGRVAGQIGGTIPVLLAGGEALSAGGAALGEAAPFLRAPLNFLTGNVESNAVLNEAGQVTQGATLGNKALRLASTIPQGATGGAAVNKLTGQDPLQGAEIGAAFGPVASLVGSGVGKIAGAANQTIEPYVNKIMQAFKRDGYATPEAVQNKLMELGPDATLADIGPNTRDLTGAIAQAPGNGKEIIETALEDRHVGQVDRLTQAATKGLGVNPEDTYGSVLSKIEEQQKAQAAPNYADAFKNNTNIASPIIDKILKTPAGQQALNFARIRMQNRMALMGVPDPELAEQMRLTGQYEPGNGGVSSGLKLETLDLVKQGLDDQVAVKLRQGENGAASDLISLKQGLVKQLDDLDSTGGSYAKARSTYADKAQAKDALEAGYDYVSKGANSDPETLSKLSDAQKSYFRIGVANKLNDTLQNAPDGADAVKRIFGSPGKRQVLESVFPNKEAFEDFANTANRESTFAKTRQSVLKNSLTNPRIQSSEDLATPLQKTVDLAHKAGNITWNMASTNTLGKGAYIAGLLKNRLMKPGVLSAEDSQALAHALVTPEGRAQVIKTLTPTSNRGQDLLSGYINALHSGGIAALTGNKLLSAPNQ